MPVDFNQLLITSGIALGLGLLIAIVVPRLARRLGRRWSSMTELVDSTKTPFRVLVAVIAINAVVATNRPRGEGTEPWDAVAHLLLIVGLINGAWLATAIVLFIIDSAVRRASNELSPRHAMRVHTQMQVTRRVIIALVVILTIAAVLLTFDGVRAVGASLIASAGVASVVAAVAAQSTLGNFFAGLQLAFSDAVRLDDTVVIEGEYGTIEEITLTYVVVRIWDDRRLVLPCTHFTITPFENWSRRGSEVIGTVEIDLDWRIDTEGLRAELDRILTNSEFYNGASSGLVITEATEGYVRARASVSADDPGDLWALRCLVREELIAWVQRNNPEALPRQRVQMLPQNGPPAGEIMPA